MKKYILAAIAGLVAPASAVADCDCTILPYRPNPPCFDQCTAKLLSRSDFKTLTSVFGVRPEAAEKITAIPSSKKPRDFSGYASILPEKDFKALQTRLYNLSPKDLEQLNAPNLRYDKPRAE